MTKRILIVDDETYIRHLLRRTLEDLELEGAEIHFAEDGEEGVARAKAIIPDLIIMDLMMPRMDGVAACREIRRDPSLVGAHVIMLTARGQPPSASAGEGPHEVMTKPFDPDRIVTRAAEVLGFDLDFEP